MNTTGCPTSAAIRAQACSRRIGGSQTLLEQITRGVDVTGSAKGQPFVYLEMAVGDRRPVHLGNDARPDPRRE